MQTKKLFFPCFVVLAILTAYLSTHPNTSSIYVSTSNIYSNTNTFTRPLIIVIPFLRKHLPLLFASLQRWIQYLPCSFSQNNTYLVFYIDTQFAPALQSSILYLWNHILDKKIQQCFSNSSPIFLQAYLRDDLGYPDGPCESFLFHFQFESPFTICILVLDGT